VSAFIEVPSDIVFQVLLYQFHYERSLREVSEFSRWVDLSLPMRRCKIGNKFVAVGQQFEAILTQVRQLQVALSTLVGFRSPCGRN
jgi:hypothetical protein